MEEQCASWCRLVSRRRSQRSPRGRRLQRRTARWGLPAPYLVYSRSRPRSTEEQLMASIDHPKRASAPSSARRTTLLAAGDALAFMVFAALGRASHSEAAGLDAIMQVAETAAPFAAGW